MAHVGGGRGRSYLGEINVVPLVDVVLVLLIIFMVTAPMLVQGLDVRLPVTDSGALKTSEHQLVITITRDGKVFLDEYEVGIEGLAAKLRGIVARRKGVRVYLRADREVPYGVVVQVLAEARRAGITDLGMVTEPSPSEKKKKR